MWSALRRDGSSRSIYRDRNPSSGSSSHQQHQRRSNSRDRSLGTLTKNQPFSIIVLALYILHFKSQKKTTLGYIHNSSKLSVTSITFRIPFRDSAGLFQTINQQWLPTTPSLPPQPPLRPSTMPLRRTPLPPHPLS